jgi:hypothetical protein
VKILAFVLGILVMFPANSRNLGQWADNDPAISKWYRDLKRPDVPSSSCCAETDAYWCDDIHVKDDKTFCTITDDRPDQPRGRVHIPVGTVIEIPPEKLKWDRGNPTGHSIVFLANGFNWYGKNGAQPAVWCFVQSTGI